LQFGVGKDQNFFAIDFREKTTAGRECGNQLLIRNRFDADWRISPACLGSLPKRLNQGFCFLGLKNSRLFNAGTWASPDEQQRRRR